MNPSIDSLESEHQHQTKIKRDSEIFESVILCTAMRLMAQLNPAITIDRANNKLSFADTTAHGLTVSQLEIASRYHTVQV
jgi:hypothetical protein